MNQEQKLECLLRIADNTLIHGQRLSEWCGHGPVLEEDIALANISLDYFGQATNLLKYAAEVENKGRDEDGLAFLRDVPDFRNFLLLELPNGDYAQTIGKHFFFSVFYHYFLEALSESSDEFMRGFAEKSLKEVKYHKRHASDWVLRLGDGTDESHKRMQKAVDDLWIYTPEFFMADDLDLMAHQQGLAPDLTAIKPLWMADVSAVLKEAGLTIPPEGWGQSGSRRGMHTEHLGFLLAEMQFLPRAYPGAKW